ncbi:hypothetical protein [Proteiniclasticum ruminis]|uniref:Uncharacterized protein n=1 Tax=Proteiniclasticum ruminis TaxID=398199 RepID=A0A1I4ZKV3_9CLOT|nr:hypothetical protein [Proteiniclasticum ruminis]SFN50590.1 hypothetical protein SAMN04488695_10225 [Proteiniclasticum ruminis]
MGMTRKEINKYIEAMMQEAQRNVKEHIESEHESRKQNLMNKYDLKNRVEDIREDLFKVEEKINAIIKDFSNDGVIKHDYWRTPIGLVMAAANMMSSQDFYNNQFDPSKDDAYRALEKFKEESLKSVRVNYSALRENTAFMPPIKAEEYLISLGFILPNDGESTAIMKPLNEKFLIAKGVKSDE